MTPNSFTTSHLQQPNSNGPTAHELFTDAIKKGRDGLRAFREHLNSQEAWSSYVNNDIEDIAAALNETTDEDVVKAVLQDLSDTNKEALRTIGAENGYHGLMRHLEQIRGAPDREYANDPERADVSRKRKQDVDNHVDTKFLASLKTGTLQDLTADPHAIEPATLFMLLVEFGRVDVLTEMLESDPACIFAASSNGGTALHRAAEANQPDVIRLLVKSGLDVNRMDSGGLLPVHYAAKTGSMAALHALLQAENSRLDATTSSGMTLLHIAAAMNDATMVEALLGMETDINLKDAHGHWPVHHAIVRGSLNALKVLARSKKIDMTAKGPWGMNPLHLASRSNKPEIVRFLLDHGLDVDGADESENGPLHYAVLGGSLESLDVLLEAKGNKIDRINLDGNTALSFAVQKGMLPISHRLLSRGATPFNAWVPAYSPLYLALFRAKKVENNLTKWTQWSKLSRDMMSASTEEQLHGNGDPWASLLVWAFEKKYDENQNMLFEVIYAYGEHYMEMVDDSGKFAQALARLPRDPEIIASVFAAIFFSLLRDIGLDQEKYEQALATIDSFLKGTELRRSINEAACSFIKNNDGEISVDTYGRPKGRFGILPLLKSTKNYVDPLAAKYLQTLGFSVP